MDIGEEDDEAIWTKMKKAVFDFRYPVGTVRLLTSNS
jgi:hypothetical protein